MTPLAATEAERLTLEQCDEFRRHPGTFNQMVQAIYDAGQARALQQTAEPVASPSKEFRSAREALQRVIAQLEVLHEDREPIMAAIIASVALLLSDDLEEVTAYFAIKDAA